MRTSIRGTRIWLSILVLIGAHTQATASCDISGSSLMFQGIEKRDGASTGTQASTQSKAQPQPTSAPTTSTPSR